MSKTAEEIDDDADDQEIETLDVEDDEIDEVEEAEDISDDDDEEEDDDDDDSLVVTIDGVSPPPEEEDEARAPIWVRDLRKNYNEKKLRVKELEQKLEALQKQEERVAPLGPMPTLEGSDYDSKKYETVLAKWYEQKMDHDRRAAAQRAQQEEAQRGWEAKLETYQTAKKSLKVRDFEFAEDVVQDTLNIVQQGIIVQGTENPALLIYALGKNPKKAQELASIDDPVKFAIAVGKLETKVAAQDRKATSKPEKKVTGSGRISGSIDNTLERLRAEAERTGDFSKVIQYKKQKRSA